jgi:hypothetical protein
LRRRSLLLPLSAAGAVVAATAALATGGAGGPDRADGADLAPPRVLASTPLGPDLSWSRTAGDDVITVRGDKCPKSHPHKVGSSSAARWTRIDGGPIKHRSSHAVICAR